MAANYANYANGAVCVIGVIRGRNISFSKIDERSRLQGEQQIAGHKSSHNSATVSANNNQLVQVFYLQAVIEGIAESMCPMKEG